MPADIQPSLGHGALFTQAGQPLGYDAIDLRRALSPRLQEGVVAASSYKVTQRAAGANLSVDIAATTHENGIGAFVQGDAVTGQGLYPVPIHTAVINEAISSNATGNPRIDQVILELLDDTHDSSGNNKARVRVLTGTATSGATLDNRSGAAALPNSAVRLADIRVAAGASSVTNADIRDRRPWARGFNAVKTRTSGTITVSGTTLAEIDTDMKLRGEFTGVPVQVEFQPGLISAGGSGKLEIEVWIDGASHTTPARVRYGATATSQDPSGGPKWRITGIAPGSHTISIAAARATSDWSLGADTTRAMYFTVCEDVRQFATNE